MNLAQAIEEVLTLTKRPDKRAAIINELNKSLAFFTLKANFARDLVELSIPIDAAQLGQTIDLSLLTVPLTRFRKFKYLKPRGQRYYLQSIDPEHLFTPGGIIQTNRYYVAGQSLTFVLSKPDAYLEAGYYQYAPVLTELANTHWMLEMMPWAIIERAAASIFKSIGDEVSAKFYEHSSMEFFLVARRDFEDQITASAR